MARSLLDDKCEDVIVLDIADMTTVTGCLVIGTGTSERQMRSALTSLKQTAESFGARPARTSADDNATWLLADFIDVVVHLFEPNARAYYDLESMWPDAQRVEPAPPQPKHAAAQRPAGDAHADQDRPA
jgi:ribosome-associated protein